MLLPEMATIEQYFDYPSIEDVAQETRTILQQAGVLAKIGPGSRVAVGVGSRGIGGYIEIVDALCQTLRGLGAVPFLFPAMGSHGGGTSQGQREVLHALGFDERAMGVEILSEAHGVRVGETAEGIPLYVDKNAMKADLIVLVNRIKPHTMFKGAVESGIAKMMTVGMGKVEGAVIMHKFALQFGFPHVIITAAQKMAQLVPFCFGIAILETPAKKVHSLTVVTPDTMIEREGVLLKRAFEIMARIPFEEMDLLIVDEIGKEISGTGMDTNITGRNRHILGSTHSRPRITRIFVRDLTLRTHGNANGIGLADFTTRRLKEKIDLVSTYKNALTSMSPEKAAIPVYFDSDREAIEAALDSVGLTDGREARVVRIKNTVELSRMQVSCAMLALIETIKTPKITITQSPCPMVFDPQGNLQS